jgi:hypothetical protein
MPTDVPSAQVLHLNPDGFPLSTHTVQGLSVWTMIVFEQLLRLYGKPQCIWWLPLGAGLVLQAVS